MNWRIEIGFLLLILSSCWTDPAAESDANTLDQQSINSIYVVDYKEFKERIKKPNHQLIDFRKQQDFDEGHIKNALHIWRSDIEDHSHPYGGMMANRIQIEELFSQMGISSADTLLIYDDKGLCNAARLWWVLQNYDFDQVKLLNGGMDEWLAHQGELTTEVKIAAPTAFKLPSTNSMKYSISREEMAKAIHSNHKIVDSRTRDEFTGKRRKKGAHKAGRIPGSILIDWAESINFNGNMKIRSPEDLKSIYTQHQLEPEDSIIVYCHSGVRSAHTTFILTQMLNYKHVRNYDGSWIEWSYFDELSFEKDSITVLTN